jgi:hypothetical protein
VRLFCLYCIVFIDYLTDGLLQIYVFRLISEYPSGGRNGILFPGILIFLESYLNGR